MDQFTEALSQLSDMSDDDLATLESSVVDAFDAADTAGDTDTMISLADLVDQIRCEQDTRTGADNSDGSDIALADSDTSMAASAAGDKIKEVVEEVVEKIVEVVESALEAVSDPYPAPVVEETPVVEPEVEPVVDTEPVVEAGVEVAEVATPALDALVEDAPVEDAPVVEVATEVVEAPAETPVVEADADVVVPNVEVAPVVEAASEVVEVTTPEVTEGEPEVAEPLTNEDVSEAHAVTAAAAPIISIRAGGDITGVTAGSSLNGMDGVIDAFQRKINSFRAVNIDSEPVIVASFKSEAEVPESRFLRQGDLEGNMAKIREFLADKDGLQANAVTAGAWCAPRTAIYDVPTVGTTRRPVQAGLPTFNADRGGIRYVTPPSIPTSGQGTSLWHTNGTTFSAFTDPAGLVSASPSTDKPLVTISCGTEVTADVDAIPTILCFDNLTAKAFPEWIRANTEISMVWQARFAEQVLLSKMFAVATTGCSATPYSALLGVARDFLSTIRTVAAQKRYTLRLEANTPFQLLAPSWLREAMAVDLAIQTPGDSTFGASYDEIDGYFANINIQPIWYMDDVPGTAAFSSVCAFPTTANWLMFPTGAFIRLDNGELNLGIVRTKDDLVKNKFCQFAETFETVAYMGPSNNEWLARGIATVGVRGSSPALTTEA